MHVVKEKKPSIEPGQVRISERELSFTFSCSGGPGGQNVNKRETKARLSFDFLKSNSLTMEQKNTILRSPNMKHLIHGDGVISIACQVHKTQWENRQESINQLHKLLDKVLAPQKERIPGGKPPNLGYEPSEHRKRQMRREEQRTQKELKVKIGSDQY